MQLHTVPDFTIMHKAAVIPRVASNNDGSDAPGGRVLMQAEVVDNLFMKSRDRGYSPVTPRTASTKLLDKVRNVDQMFPRAAR